jgi:hypothetical protein
VPPCSLPRIYQRFGGKFSFLSNHEKQLVTTCKSIRRYNPKDRSRHLPRRDNLKLQTNFVTPSAFCTCYQRLQLFTKQESRKNTNCNDKPRYLCNYFGNKLSYSVALQVVIKHSHFNLSYGLNLRNSFFK